LRSCITIVLALAAASALPQTLTQDTVGDVWVYDRATDPRFDPILRVWGNGTDSYNKNGYPPGEQFSHGYLMFDLSGISAQEYFVTKATLRLRMRPATYTLDAARANLLEARALGTNWDEATWSYGANNPNPEAVRFGTGDLTNYSQTVEWDMTLDLLGEAGFESRFNQAVNGDKKLAIAMTSSILVQGQGGAPYRFYSRDYGIPGSAPQIDLAFTPVPEPGMP
jgi:hypothetical protein